MKKTKIKKESENMKEKIILKSSHPELYGDLEIECKVIENDKIGEYLQTIPEERKFNAYKNGEVIARKGIPGEIIKTVLTTVIDGKEYILSEEEQTVSLQICKTSEGIEIEVPHYVITNISSTSNEQYVVKPQKFQETYEFTDVSETGIKYVPVYDSRLLAQVDENVIIITAWGSKAICLKGGYIVTYSAENNDYNVLEKGAFESTYTKEKNKQKNLK